jgi:hypothetical protein
MFASEGVLVGRSEIIRNVDQQRARWQRDKCLVTFNQYNLVEFPIDYEQLGKHPIPFQPLAFSDASLI